MISKPTKEENREYARLRRLAFPDEQRRASNNWKKRNPEYCYQYQKEYWKDRPEQHRANVSRWARANPEKVNAMSRRRYANNLNYRISHNLRVYLGISLKRQRLKKTDRTMDLLGCSIVDFRIYIESLFEPGMTWENYGKNPGCWEIDHIIPCAVFDLTDPGHRKRCFHFSNMQPLWCPENRRKGQILSGFLKE
jgi:hypothetical protein